MMTQLIQTISPLRQRMIEEMTMRKLSPKTQIGKINKTAIIKDNKKTP